MEETKEKCISCGGKDDLFRLQYNEGYICRECLFRQYDFIGEKDEELNMYKSEENEK